ncbi:MAG: ABC transporter permease, partial [Pseudomonadota bacterium]
MIVLLFYVALFLAAFALVSLARRRMEGAHDFTSLKTVTFGDESAVRPDRAASIISILVIFLIWGAFTGSKIVPFHVPGPFSGETSFEYTARNAAGDTDDATVTVIVHPLGEDVEPPDVPLGEGFAKNDSDAVAEWRTTLIRANRNDEGREDEGFVITQVNGRPIAPGETVRVDHGSVTMTPRGSLNFEPSKGLQMEPIWLPAPEAVVSRFFEIMRDGYQNFTLVEHVGWS